MPIIHIAHLEVRPLTVRDAPTCDQIILSLPRHFGYESGRQACAQAVRTQEGWAAVSNGRKVGFLPVCEVPLYWGVGSDPALLLIMPP
jgi:hypothetical protein